MASQVDIYNMAVQRVGTGSTRIEDPTEQSKEALSCQAFWALVYDYVLCDVDWNFATVRVALNDLDTPPTNWGYRYALPSDCVRIRNLTLPGCRNPRLEQMPAFQVGTDGIHRELYTDISPAELVYTARVGIGLWSEQAASALAWRLAAEIAMPLTMSPQIADNAFKGYAREVSIAAARNYNERGQDPEPLAESLAVRGLGTTWPPDGRIR